MSGSLWIPSTDVSGDQATIAANKRWQSRLFTSSGTWVVPADVGLIFVDGCGGGTGGSGGYAGVGGGGAGGGAAAGVIYGRFPVAPGETLTLTIGAGGVGGAIGATADYTAGDSKITGSLEGWVFQPGYVGQKAATVSAGGAVTVSAPYNGTTAFTDSGPTDMHFVTSGVGGQYHITLPGAGGAPGVAGDLSSIVPLKPNHPTLAASYTPGGVSNGSGGGGGAGGNGPFGHSGRGGDGGAAGGNATGYGAGGGGGGSNGAGGNGSPGMIRIYCFSATTI